MAGHFTVEVSLTPIEEDAKKGQASAVTTVTSYGGFKGSVALVFTCESTDAGDDPDLSKYSESVFVDANVPGESTVTITGNDGQGVEFTADGTHPTGGHDLDTKTGNLGP